MSAGQELSPVIAPGEVVGALVLLAVLGGVYFLMWRGWRNRARKHAIADLVPVPERSDGEPLLHADGRYFGTTVHGQWLDRVVARGLGGRSVAELSLFEQGLDVLRHGSGHDPFHIPRAALRAARHERGIAGKVVPPHGLLVVTWEHGDYVLDSGFRLASPGEHEAWVRTISTLAEEHIAWEHPE